MTLPLRSILLLSIAGAAAGAAPAQTSPTLLHHFTFSSDANSNIGAGATGTLVGGASIADDALNLTGPTAYVELGRLIPMTEDFGSSRWTVSTWLRQTANHAPDSYATVIGAGGNPDFLPGYNVSLSSYGGAQAVPVVFQGTGYGVAASGTETVSAGDWHHVAIVASSLAATLYVDGIQVGSGGSSLKFTPNFINNGTTRFGRQVLNYGQQFTGQMDDVRIYAGGLTAQAVEAEFLAGRSVMPAVPEPASYALFALGLVAMQMALLRRRGAAPGADGLIRFGSVKAVALRPLAGWS